MTLYLIEVDGIIFYVPVVSVTRKADVLDRYANRTESGVLRRSVIGVYYNYSIQFGATYDAKEYAKLWDKLTEPVAFHKITVPGTNGDYTFTAYITGVQDEVMLVRQAYNYFKNLQAEFTAQTPARTGG